MKKIYSILFTLLFISTVAFTVRYSVERPQAYKIGDVVSNFQLKNIDGTMLDFYNFLEKQQAKGVAIVFMSNTCPYAIATEERLMNFDKKYKSKGFPVIAINSNVRVVEEESFTYMQKRAAEKNYSYPYLADESQNIAATFGAKRTPHVFLLQKDDDQKMRLKYIGAFDNNPLDIKKVTKTYTVDAVKALMKNKSIEKTKIKAIGCGIKWMDEDSSTSAKDEQNTEGYATSQGESTGLSATEKTSCCAGNSKACCKAKAQKAALENTKKSCSKAAGIRKAESNSKKTKACSKSKKQKPSSVSTTTESTIN